MVTRRVRTEFDANTAQFDRGVRRMNDNMRRFQRGTETRLDRIDRRFRRAGQGVQTLQRAIAGLALVAGARRLASGVERAVDSLDNIAKSADAIGITTGALQELRVAAELSGVSTEQLDTSLRRFARTASDAREGLATAKRGFDEMGISVTDNDGKLKDLDALLIEVADGFAGMDDATRKAALAQELFGRSGTAMVNMLNEGSAGIERMRAEARRLGIVIDEELIRESVRLRDELTLLQRQLDSDTTQAMVRLGPVIRDLGQLMVWLANRAADAHEGWRRLFRGELFSSRDNQLAQSLADAQAELEALDAQFAKLAETGQTELGARLGIKPEDAADSEQALDRFNVTLDEFAARRTELVERIEGLQKELAGALGGGVDVVPAPGTIEAPPLPTASGGGGGGGSLSAEATEERTSALERELRVLAERTAELARMTEMQARLDPEMEGYTTALRAAEVEARLLALAEAEGAEVKGDLAQRIREVAQAYAEAEAASEALRETQSELDQTPRIFDDMARGLEGAISQARTFEEALQNVLAVLAQVALRAALQSAFGGGGGGVLAGVFHRGGRVGSPTVQRQLPAATFLGAPRMHSGGIAGLRPNEVPAILEKGEIVVPKNIGMGRGGNSITINEGDLHITEPGATPEQIRRLMAEERRATIEEIIRMNDDDPSILKT